MKISNEAKVGILAIVAIIVLIFGFNFLKGNNVFNKAPTIYAVFKNIGSLERSNQVKINGLPVGTVYGFVPGDKEVNSIIVEIHLTRDINIPKNSVAFLDGALIGSSFINIEKGNANSYLKPGDTISTKLEAGIMSDLKTQMAPTLTRVNETLDSLKMTLGSVNQIFDPNTNSNLQTLIARLTITSGYMQDMLNSQTGALAQSLNNMNAVTGNLARNNDAISSSIRNVEITTSNLANARIQETIGALEGTINELKGTAAGLRGTIDKFNSPNGTLGALVNDRKLYDQLNKAALGLEILLDDVRLHPKRYVNISVFGGKSKSDPLTSPSLKDSVAVPLGIR
ncbi:MAG TPA: MlaD family protein [Flavisolibacter sp.]|jgi:phospholipid/cholesterol/gamma-HCH transport system substrate-binding protein|nr:MlaD family protein [Flavisolibacter sp.]